MPTVTCPKCSAKVDTDLMACPNCGLSRLTEAKQNFYKKIIKIVLIPFNIFMLVWLIASLQLLANAPGVDVSIELQKQLPPIVIIVIWVVGDLLMLAYLWFKKTNLPK